MVAEVSSKSIFPFFYCTTPLQRLGKMKISFHEDVYICPWSLSHDFCMYIPNTCGCSVNNTCGRSDKMCLELKGLISVSPSLTVC